MTQFTGSASHRSMLAAIAVGVFTMFPVVGGGDEAPATNDGVRTIYLIRHGEYDQEDERDPDVGKALVPLGVAQARLLGSRLRSLPVEFSSLHSSTMTRARETALVIGEEFPDLGLQTSTLIRECMPPTWRKDVMAEEDPEDIEACQETLEKAYPLYLKPSPEADQHDLIVCHGNVIRYFVTKVLGVDTESWLRMSIGNCSLTVIVINADGSMKLLSYGDVGHIPPNLQTRTAPGGPGGLEVPAVPKN